MTISFLKLNSTDFLTVSTSSLLEISIDRPERLFGQASIYKSLGTTSLVEKHRDTEVNIDKHFGSSAEVDKEY